VRIVPSVPFDWDDTAAVYLVTAYSQGTGLGGGDKVTLLTAPPASLTNAVDIGARPRVYFSQGANQPAVALLTEVVAYDVGAKTVDLISPNPTGWVNPTPAASLMLAGSAAYTPIATALHDYVNSLGPSRASGYADTLQPWDDTLRIAVISELALAVVDVVDGVTHLALDMVVQPTIDEVTANVVGSDAFPSTPPELLWTKAIQVTV
jgi:hypothetical protein